MAPPKRLLQSGGAMPRYFFVIDGDDVTDRDDDGTQLPHPEAARRYARRVIRELREAGGYDDPNLAMFVKDANGDILFSVPFLGSLH
jgi:hypothetical protein